MFCQLRKFILATLQQFWFKVTKAELVDYAIAMKKLTHSPNKDWSPYVIEPLMLLTLLWKCPLEVPFTRLPLTLGYSACTLFGDTTMTPPKTRISYISAKPTARIWVQFRQRWTSADSFVARRSLLTKTTIYCSGSPMTDLYPIFIFILLLSRVSWMSSSGSNSCGERLKYLSTYIGM